MNGRHVRKDVALIKWKLHLLNAEDRMGEQEERKINDKLRKGKNAGCEAMRRVSRKRRGDECEGERSGMKYGYIERGGMKGKDIY